MKQYTFSSYIRIVSIPFTSYLTNFNYSVNDSTHAPPIQKREWVKHTQRKSLPSTPVYEFTEYTEHTTNYLLLTRSYIPAANVSFLLNYPVIFLSIFYIKPESLSLCMVYMRSIINKREDVLP